MLSALKELFHQLPITKHAAVYSTVHTHDQSSYKINPKHLVCSSPSLNPSNQWFMSVYIKSLDCTLKQNTPYQFISWSHAHDCHWSWGSSWLHVLPTWLPPIPPLDATKVMQQDSCVDSENTFWKIRSNSNDRATYTKSLNSWSYRHSSFVMVTSQGLVWPMCYTI